MQIEQLNGGMAATQTLSWTWCRRMALAKVRDVVVGGRHTNWKVAVSHVIVFAMRERYHPLFVSRIAPVLLLYDCPGDGFVGASSLCRFDQPYWWIGLWQ